MIRFAQLDEGPMTKMTLPISPPFSAVYCFS